MGKFYVTTSVPYVNAPPHIGHALEFVQADVLARYHRKKGDEVFFLTGVDEHGIKIVRTAEKAGKTPKELVDENTQKFKELLNVLEISNDDFIRTSDKKRHWPGAQKLWLNLEKAGKLYKKKYRGLYCVGHEAFITEKDLIDGKCRDHKKEPEIIEEENWFFKLSDYTKEIESRIKNNELRIIPESRKNEILSLAKNGFEDISFSRPSKDLSWGVPVPNDPDHTMYVWCDALSNYITAIGYTDDEKKFKRWWPADVHVIGKDILRFHAAIWPGMLLAAGLPLPKTIFVHGFITSGGEKMSKTIGNVVDPSEIVKKYGADALRYYLLREIPSGEDGDFAFEKFEHRYNSDLANGLGNLVSRVAKLGENIQFHLFSPDIITPDIEEVIEEVYRDYHEAIDNFQFHEALVEVWKVVGFANWFIDEAKPWIKDKNKLDETIAKMSYIISEIANLLSPFLPETAKRIMKQISYAGGNIEIKKGDSIFPRLK